MILNGKLTDQFTSKGGIRQGEPLSPYLFVLAMEKFSQIINVAVEANHWKGVKISPVGMEFSYIFFADDLILFAEASCKQAEVIKDALICIAFRVRRLTTRSHVSLFLKTYKKGKQESKLICMLLHSLRIWAIIWGFSYL